MINAVSMNIHNTSMVQSKCKKNALNINFKASFVNNKKYEELCNYAKENAIRSQHFKEIVEKLKNLPDEKLVLDFGVYKSLEDSSYGGALKQGRVPIIKKKFVSIRKEGNNIYPAPLEFSSDSLLSPLERAYQAILLLADKKEPLYEPLFVEKQFTNSFSGCCRDANMVLREKIEEFIDRQSWGPSLNGWEYGRPQSSNY